MIRTIKISAIAICSMVILWACGGGASAPKDVAKSFLDAVESGDSLKAKDHATETTQAQLAMFFAFAKEPTKRDVTIGEEKIDGDNATVNYKLKGDEKDHSLKLKKVDGKWKAETTKSELQGGDGANPMGDLGNMMEGAVDSLGGAMEEAGKEMKEAGEEEKKEGEHKAH